MIEPRHAQQYWLRSVGREAEKLALEQSPDVPGVSVNRTAALRLIEWAIDDLQAVSDALTFRKRLSANEALVSAIAYALRAAVLLRRSR